MADIIVTTPKSQMKAAAQEAADAIASFERGLGLTEYFRRFPLSAYPKNVESGDRVYYVEDGYVRGFAVASRIEVRGETRCDTTMKMWYPGAYIFMQADSWRWIKPIAMKGFQGFRYIDAKTQRAVEVVGGWRDPRPGTDVPEGDMDIEIKGPKAPMKRIGTMQTIDVNTGEVLETKHNAGMLLPPGLDVCQECGVKHNMDYPHDKDSLYYQMQFHSTHGRYPTWTDALSHVPEPQKSSFRQVLIGVIKKNGLPIPDDLMDPKPSGR